MTDSIVRTLIRGLLPYPDPFRRRNVRASARDLVECQPWPGNNASRDQVVQLVVLRAMWLQQETRRAARWRQREATGLLARASVENSLVGLYCLQAQDPVDELRGSNSKGTRRMFRYLTDGEVVTSEMLASLGRAIGGTSELPTLWDMAKAIDAEDNVGACDLYNRLFVPLSSMYIHTNATSLLRHVSPSGSVRTHASSAWTLRSAVRTADGCLGLVATGLAKQCGRDHRAFADYGRSHLSRSLAPLAVLIGRHLPESIEWTRVPDSFRAIAAAPAYVNSPSYRADSQDERERRVREFLERALGPVRADVDDTVREEMIDEWVSQISRRLAQDGASA